MKEWVASEIPFRDMYHKLFIMQFSFNKLEEDMRAQVPPEADAALVYGYINFNGKTSFECIAPARYMDGKVFLDEKVFGKNDVVVNIDQDDVEPNIHIKKPNSPKRFLKRFAWHIDEIHEEEEVCAQSQSREFDELDPYRHHTYPDIIAGQYEDGESVNIYIVVKPLEDASFYVGKIAHVGEEAVNHTVKPILATLDSTSDPDEPIIVVRPFTKELANAVSADEHIAQMLVEGFELVHEESHPDFENFFINDESSAASNTASAANSWFMPTVDRESFITDGRARVARKILDAHDIKKVHPNTHPLETYDFEANLCAEVLSRSLSLHDTCRIITTILQYCFGEQRTYEDTPATPELEALAQELLDKLPPNLALDSSSNYHDVSDHLDSKIDMYDFIMSVERAQFEQRGLPAEIYDYQNNPIPTSGRPRDQWNWSQHLHGEL